MSNFTIDEIQTRLTSNQSRFFENLSKYINYPIYFYGSIYRADYIPGKSDIDSVIFTDNESSTIEVICNFLNKKRSDIKKTVMKINDKVVYGFKTQYNDAEHNIDTEISIYNEKHKDLVMQDYKLGQQLSLHITVLLYIIKYLFYNLKIISSKTYKRCKQFLMNPGDELKFIQL